MQLLRFSRTLDFDELAFTEARVTKAIEFRLSACTTASLFEALGHMVAPEFQAIFGDRLDLLEEHVEQLCAAAYLGKIPYMIPSQCFDSLLLGRLCRVLQMEISMSTFFICQTKWDYAQIYTGLQFQEMQEPGSPMHTVCRALNVRTTSPMSFWFKFVAAQQALFHALAVVIYLRESSVKSWKTLSSCDERAWQFVSFHICFCRCKLCYPEALKCGPCYYANHNVAVWTLCVRVARSSLPCIQNTHPAQSRWSKLHSFNIDLTPPMFQFQTLKFLGIEFQEVLDRCIIIIPPRSFLLQQELHGA